eukprot:Gb_33354 [translate_table: standard]
MPKSAPPNSLTSVRLSSIEAYDALTGRKEERSDTWRASLSSQEGNLYETGDATKDDLGLATLKLRNTTLKRVVLRDKEGVPQSQTREQQFRSFGTWGNDMKAKELLLGGFMWSLVDKEGEEKVSRKERQLLVAFHSLGGKGAIPGRLAWSLCYQEDSKDPGRCLIGGTHPLSCPRVRQGMLLVDLRIPCATRRAQRTKEDLKHVRQGGNSRVRMRDRGTDKKPSHPSEDQSTREVTHRPMKNLTSKGMPSWVDVLPGWIREMIQARRPSESQGNG